MGMDIFSIARTGLDASSRKLEVSAENIANLETDGYKAKQVTNTTDPSGGVKSSEVKVTDEPTNVAQETINQIVASTTYKANAQVVKTAEDISGALFDIKA